MERQDEQAEHIDTPGSDECRQLEHELRNVFTIIASNLDLMNRATEDQNTQRRLVFMQSAVEAGMGALRRAADRCSSSRSTGNRPRDTFEAQARDGT